MARRATQAPAINTPVQKGGKGSQRERLIAGMVAAANRGGYSGANVSAVIGQAGVSRPTFYDYFTDRDDCFAATIADIQEQLLSDVEDTVAASAPEDALAVAASTLVAFATSDPGRAQFLMNDALAGGHSALDARDRGILEIARVVDTALDGVPPGTPAPDQPLVESIGAIQRLLASRLRRSERSHSRMLEELQSWIASYSRPAREHRWRKIRHLAPPQSSPFVPPTGLRPPPGLASGRPRIPEEAVAENHRHRVMFATAQAVQEHGYNSSTVGQIAKLAGVDTRVFYRLFSDRQDAFSAVHELGFQYLMAVTAGAFFAGEDWPQRMWEAMRAVTESVQRTPAVAHVGFVEAYTVGARGIQRVEDSRAAFTIFLQEGARLKESQAPLGRTALEASITTVFEAIYRSARESATPRTMTLTASLAYVCLAPVLGPADAERFIEEKLNAGKRKPRRKTTSKRA